MQNRHRSPALAAALSLVLPGAGQWHVGNPPTAIALLCATIGVWLGIAISLWGPSAFRSFLTTIVLSAVYPFICIPAAIDAHQACAGSASPLLSRHNRGYVIFMLLTVGPLSLPMLWQNPRFSRTAKIIWTAFIIAVFVFGVLLAVFFLPWLERIFRDFGVWPL